MKRNTRDLILKTAAAHLARDGTLSVNGVIQESGLSKGVFFHHFHSKLELMLELANNDFVQRIEQIKDCAKTLPETPGRMLKAYVLTWVGSIALTSREELNALRAFNEPILQEKIREHSRHLLDMVWDPALPDVVVRIVVNACIGGWVYDLVGERSKEEMTAAREEIAKGLFEIIDHFAEITRTK